MKSSEHDNKSLPPVKIDDTTASLDLIRALISAQVAVSSHSALCNISIVDNESRFEACVSPFRACLMQPGANSSYHREWTSRLKDRTEMKPKFRPHGVAMVTSRCWNDPRKTHVPGDAPDESVGR